MKEWIEEFDRTFRRDEDLCLENIKSFISSLLDQAVARERDKLIGKIERTELPKPKVFKRWFTGNQKWVTRDESNFSLGYATALRDLINSIREDGKEQE